MTGQSETKHTPGELRVRAVSDIDFTHEIATIGGIPIAAVYKGDSPANAARIALTWNCHDEMVAALQAADRRLHDEGFSVTDPVTMQVRAALAKASA